MSVDVPTIEQLRRIEEGDRVRIEYDSVFTDRGERTTLEAIVVENDIYEWTGQDEAVNVTIDLDHQGPDERKSFETERTRQYEAMFFEGKFQYSQVNTRNGARWNRLSKVGDDPTIERANGDFELLEEAVGRDDLPPAAQQVLERAEKELKAAEFRDLLDDNEEAIEALGLTEGALPDRGEAESMFVQGHQVGALFALEPPAPWENISGESATRLPSFENTETGDMIRVSINQSPPTYRAFRHRPPKGPDPDVDANTDRAMAEALLDYFHER